MQFLPGALEQGEQGQRLLSNLWGAGAVTNFRIKGSYDDALYKWTYSLLYFNVLAIDVCLPVSTITKIIDGFS